MKNRIPFGLPASLVAIIACSLSASAQTGYEWGREFDTPNLLNGEIKASAVFDDGRGPALYLAGEFWRINGEGAFGIVRFDGTDWEPLGGGLTEFGVTGSVSALTVFDPDGSGPQPELLVAGGRFHAVNGISTPVNNVAAWDGTTWSDLGGGITVPIAGFSWPEILDLESFDDGTGPKLYAAGTFKVGGKTGMAVWNGQSWSAIGSTGASSGWARALEVFDEGAGPRLFVGGNFGGIVGVANSSQIARWDGTSFSSLGATFGDVQGFVTFDADGTGPLPEKLVASGGGDLDVWDGSTVTHVAGFTSALTAALAVFDDGSGPAVYLGANDIYSSLGNKLHKWDGVAGSMVPVGSVVDKYLGTAFMETLVVFQGEMFAGGYFSGTQAAPSKALLKWTGSDWTDPFPRKGLANYQPQAGSSGKGDPSLLGAVTFDAGGGEEIFVGGTLNRAGSVVINSGIAAWKAGTWRDAGPLTAPGSTELAVPMGTWDDGSGLALYAGVELAAAGGFKLYRLNGAVWTEVGASSAAFAALPKSMAVFDDGSGAALFVTAGSDVFRWDGMNWSLVASTTGGLIGLELNRLEVFDDGSGPALFFSGSFQSVAGISATNVARFDGTTWSPVGGGTNSLVNWMGSYDDGSGSGTALYVGGWFTSAGGVAATSSVARWDGSTWSALGSGAPGLGGVLGVYNDGTTTRLYAGMYDPFAAAWGNLIRTWDGSVWADVPNSFSTWGASGLLEHADGKGPGVYFWGSFHGLGGSVVDPMTTIDSANQAGGLARWGLPNSPFSVSGVGCSMYSSDIPTIHGVGLAQTGSASFVTSVKNVPAGLPAALIVGTDTNFWLGIPLPLDLAVMGWAGCNLYQSWDFTFWTATSGVGTTGGGASMPLVIPSQASLVGLGLGLQWAIVSPTPLGVDLGVTPLGEVVIE